MCRIPRIVSSQAWDSECSPRFEALLSTRGGPFSLFLPLPCPPASTSPGEGLPGGLLEGSCGRRKRISMRNRPNVGTFVPASENEMLIRRWCIYNHIGNPSTSERVPFCFTTRITSSETPSSGHIFVPRILGLFPCTCGPAILLPVGFASAKKLISVTVVLRILGFFH